MMGFGRWKGGYSIEFEDWHEREHERVHVHDVLLPNGYMSEAIDELILNCMFILAHDDHTVLVSLNIQGGRESC